MESPHKPQKPTCVCVCVCVCWANGSVGGVWIQCFYLAQWCGRGSLEMRCAVVSSWLPENRDTAHTLTWRPWLDQNCIDTKEHCLISKRQRKITYESELTLCYYSSTKPDSKAFNPIIDLLDLGFRGKLFARVEWWCETTAPCWAGWAISAAAEESFTRGRVTARPAVSISPAAGNVNDCLVETQKPIGLKLL